MAHLNKYEMFLTIHVCDVNLHDIQKQVFYRKSVVVVFSVSPATCKRYILSNLTLIGLVLLYLLAVVDVI